VLFVESDVCDSREMSPGARFFRAKTSNTIPIDINSPIKFEILNSPDR
jgi:hypothetical protein